jgi:hypothetical protein
MSWAVCAAVTAVCGDSVRGEGSPKRRLSLHLANQTKESKDSEVCGQSEESKESEESEECGQE